MTSIFINITSLLERLLKGLLPRGLNRVELAYLAHYGTVAQAVVEATIRTKIFHFTFPLEISKQLFAILANPAEVSKIQLMALVAKGIALNTRHTNASEPSFLFNLAHNGFLSQQYASFFSNRNTRVLFMVHDLIPITHSEYCRPSAEKKHITKIRHVLNQASGIITNSDTTLQELTAFAISNQTRRPPMISAPLASGLCRTDSKATARPMTAPYFVMLGALEARKNHYFLLNLWKYLHEQMGSATPTLVIIGQQGWGYENALHFQKQCKALQPFIIEHSSCSDEQLFQYLDHAQALLFPSFVEGYGLPLVEALTLHTPVIASDLAVYQEFAKDIPEYLSPIDGRGWLEAIMAYTTNSPRRMQQTERLSRFKPPTWSDHFEKVDDFLQRLT